MNQEYIRILACDPGSSYTGIAILDLYSDGTIRVPFVETIDATYLIKRTQDVVFKYGEKYARILAIITQIENILNIYNPEIVSIEAPFYNPKRPRAYGVLCEVVSVIKYTIYRFSQVIPFYEIDPSSIKKSIGVSGTSGDKALMLENLTKIGLLYEEHLSYWSFDEHSIDALAVGYTTCVRLNSIT